MVKLEQLLLAKEYNIFMILNIFGTNNKSYDKLILIKTVKSLINE